MSNGWSKQCAERAREQLRLFAEPEENRISKTYVVSVDTMRAINAESESEALADAREKFIEMLQRGEAELIVVEEFEE